MKKCARCGIEKDKSEFNKARNRKDGLYNYCRECSKILAKETAERCKERILFYRSEYHKKNYKKELLDNIKRRAKAKNIEFNISVEDITIPETCPVLGIPIQPCGSQCKDTNPSVDRIDNTKGYIKENIIVVSWLANDIKSDASLEELEKIVSFYNNPVGATIHQDISRHITAKSTDKAEYLRQYRKSNYTKLLLHSMNTRAKKRGVGCDMTIDDLKIPVTCPVLNIPLIIGGKRCYNTPSVDRIDNSKGYTKDNTIIVSWRANDLKGTATVEQLEKVLIFYKEISK